jgi:hypothetical protein
MVSAIPADAMGIKRKKTHRQPTRSMSIPPTGGPSRRPE